MPPKQKKGFFRPIKAKAKSGRGGGDPADYWAQFIADDIYNEFKKQYDEMEAADQEAVREDFNSILDNFGDDLVAGK